MKLRSALPCLALLLAVPGLVAAEVPRILQSQPEAARKLEAAAPFGDGMVLQRGMPVPVWGLATPGAEVAVEFAGQRKSARCDAQGRWSLKLDSLEASAENRVLTILCGDRKVEFKDVLVGEVWVCAGQSNMEMGVNMSLTPEKTKAEANDPLLRLRVINKVMSPLPRQDLPTASGWLRDEPKSLDSGHYGGFSAAAYFFARKLRSELKVPVGVIQSAWGGTLIEPWTPPQGFAQVPALKKTSEWLAKVEGDYRAQVGRNLEALETFTREARLALAENRPLPPPPPAIQHPIGNQGVATALYNAHINPLVPYAIRGALWYQGESNLIGGDTAIYGDKMAALIGGWRQVWGQGDFPFYFVQLAPFKYNLPAERLAEFWEVQTAVGKTIPNTGMALTNDIGTFNDIHPKNKQEVGRRLALLALEKTYGVKLAAATGPQLLSSKIEGGAIRAEFGACAAGIRSKDGQPLQGFEICGDDGVFAAAQAEIAGPSTLLIRSDKVPSPVQARFIWNQCPTHNVVNSEGLPMNSFRTPGPKNLALKAPYTCSNPNTHGWGASGQLTDGSWAADAQGCFASNEDDVFPKEVTVDLGQVQPLKRLVFGVPAFGSTRTLVAEVSADGKTFREAGRQVFEQGKEARATLKLAATPARYVRLKAIDRHPQVKQFPVGFVFISELEVYGE
ncbi:MAG: hypothetical protein RL095_3106 [Verrucomicrobiota bacterium]|jgi:sialate O-acetylesterase